MDRIRKLPAGREILALAVLLLGGWAVLSSLNDTAATIAVLALYYAIAGLSFNFLQGTLGLFSLAQPVFLLVGGYTGAYLGTEHGTSPWISMVVAMLISAVLAVPIALACVRSTSSAILVALVTLIIAQAMAPIIVSIEALGGALGILIDVNDAPHWTDMQFLSSASYAKVLLVINVVLIAALTWFRRSRFGLWAAASRDVPAAAQAAGVPVRRLSVILFVISSIVVAPAGVVYAQYNLNVTTDLFLGTAALFQVSVVALVGGAARPWGALVGSVVVVYLTQKAGDLGGGRAGVSNLTFAILFLIMALVLPRGISGTWALISQKLALRRSGDTSSGSVGRTAPAPVSPADDRPAPVGR